MLDHVNIFSSVFSSFHPTQHENQVCKWSRSVQSLNWVRPFVTPWTAPLQASLSITNSRYLLKVMSSESVMPSNHLITCCPLLLLPSIFPSIRLFSNETALHVKSIIQAIDSNTLWEFYNFESIYACSLEEKL